MSLDTSIVLPTVFPVIYYTSGALPQEVVIGVNVANSIMILIAERSNTMEKKHSTNE